MLLLAFSLTACGGGQAVQSPQAAPTASDQQLLLPLQTIMGGRLAPALDATGAPSSSNLRGFVNFISPAVVAARGPDLYVGDAASGKLYRWDSLQQALSVVPGIVTVPRMRLQVAADLSLYVLDPDHAVILHLTRGGRLLQKFSGHGLAMNLTEFVLDEGMGRIVASDQLSQRLLRVPLAGQIISVPPDTEVGAFKSLGAVANAGEQLFVLDSACVCIVRLDADGRVQERFGYGALVQPYAMVADRSGRLFVADRVDRSLKVFQHGEMIARIEPQQLHIVNINALALDEDTLYIADGPGARVAVFRIRPPARGGDVRPQ